MWAIWSHLLRYCVCVVVLSVICTFQMLYVPACDPPVLSHTWLYAHTPAWFEGADYAANHAYSNLYLFVGDHFWGLLGALAAWDITGRARRSGRCCCRSCGTVLSRLAAPRCPSCGEAI